MWSCSAPGRRSSPCMGRPMGTSGTWPEISVCTPMLVLVRAQRYYIVADCDNFGSLGILTSGDCLVTTICWQEAVATNRFKSTHTNANVEWTPSRKHTGLSSRRHYNTHGPPHTKATPHQGFKNTLDRLGHITSLPSHWNSQGLNCAILPCCSMHYVLELQ